MNFILLDPALNLIKFLNTRNPKTMYFKKLKKTGDGRVKFRQEQTNFLNNAYNSNSKPSSKERVLIANVVGISEDKIKNWFQNRRAKERKLKLNGPCLDYNPSLKEDSIENSIYPSCNDLFKRKKKSNNTRIHH